MQLKSYIYVCVFACVRGIVCVSGNRKSCFPPEKLAFNQLLHQRSPHWLQKLIRGKLWGERKKQSESAGELLITFNTSDRHYGELTLYLLQS